jgi:hypothetical protein
MPNRRDLGRAQPHLRQYQIYTLEWNHRSPNTLGGFPGGIDEVDRVYPEEKLVIGQQCETGTGYNGVVTPRNLGRRQERRPADDRAICLDSVLGGLHCTRARRREHPESESVDCPNDGDRYVKLVRRQEDRVAGSVVSAARLDGHPARRLIRQAASGLVNALYLNACGHLVCAANGQLVGEALRDVL